MRPRISVVTPTWNRGHLLRYSLQSLIDQSFNDFEIIVVDDGSTDNTKQVLEEIQKIEPRLKCIYLKHQGIVPTLWEGNKAATGEIIVKHDSDDLSMPDRLEKIDQYFKEHPDTEFFYHGMYQTYEAENYSFRRIYKPALPIDRERILKEQYIPGFFSYTKKFITEVPYRKSYCSEDWMLLLDAVLKNRKIGYLDQGLYEYAMRVDSNSLRWEGTGAYEKDEALMQKILKEEYGIDNFKYPDRK